MAVVATGFFDGVHLGHRQVVKALLQAARLRGEEAVVATFAQHPRAVLQQDPCALRLLSSGAEKVSLLEGLGVDRVEVLDFTREFASLSAREYVREVLRDRFRASAVVLGYDNRFGSDSLRAEELVRLLGEEGMEVVRADEMPGISSTGIRRALSEGRIEDADAMLGYEYALKGVVVPGKRLGRQIGFPTANLGLCDPLKQIPSRGVYATRTEVMGVSYASMTNVGEIVETNIFDFDEDIYSLEIKVSFLRRVRDMMSFSSLDELRTRLAKDKEDVIGR